MIRRETDLILILAGTLALIALVLLFPAADGPRIALALPFVLFAPGYAIAAALYPRRGDLPGTERLVVSFGLSLAVVPLLGLALDFLPGGIQLESYLAAIALVTNAAAVGAAVRRRLLPPAEVYALDVTLPNWRPRMTKDNALRLAAPVLALGALSLALYFAATADRGETFSEFYILGEEGLAEGYPTHLTSGQTAPLRLGVVNHEGARSEYRIDIAFGGRSLRYAEGLVLEDGERWERAVYLTAGAVARGQRAVFSLFREGDTRPYRDLALKIDVTAGELVGPLPPTPAPAPTSAALGLVQSPVPGATPLPAVHIVARGEYLTLIAADYGVPLDTVLGANDLPDPDLIYPDQRIFVPDGGD